MHATRPRFEVADVVRQHGADLCRLHVVTAREAKVLRHLAECRTMALGGHRDVCGDCGFERVAYNSCRDRHCPKCQGTARAKWLERRLEHVLPIPYFHVVFTLPAVLHTLIRANREALYRALFDASASTLQHLARDERRLGAELGITSVLHTWGQKLTFHPHVHCVVTGGGLSPDGSRWVEARQSYLLPVKAMSRMFRGKYLQRIQELHRAGELHLPGSLQSLQDDSVWAAFRDRLYRANWVVYAKPPFGGPRQVFAYLGRYTHRVAISNHRIVAMDRETVTFLCRDYADGNRQKQQKVTGVEFLRRFLLHVLPHRFVRLRHYGLHASGNVGTKLVLARERIEAALPPPERAGEVEPSRTSTPCSAPVSASAPSLSPQLAPAATDRPCCPRCGSRNLQRHSLLSVYELARAPPVAS